MLPMRLGTTSENHTFPSDPRAPKSGTEPTLREYVLLSCPAVVNRPMLALVTPTNHRASSGPEQIEDKSPKVGDSDEYSVTTPAGVTSPKATSLSVNQTFPSGPAMMPVAPP